MKKVKITILKTTLDKELAAEYGIDGMTACPMMKARKFPAGRDANVWPWRGDSQIGIFVN